MWEPIASTKTQEDMYGTKREDRSKRLMYMKIYFTYTQFLSYHQTIPVLWYIYQKPLPLPAIDTIVSKAYQISYHRRGLGYLIRTFSAFYHTEYVSCITDLYLCEILQTKWNVCICTKQRYQNYIHKAKRRSDDWIFLMHIGQIINVKIHWARMAPGQQWSCLS